MPTKTKTTITCPKIPALVEKCLPDVWPRLTAKNMCIATEVDSFEGDSDIPRVCCLIGWTRTVVPSSNANQVDAQNLIKGLLLKVGNAKIMASPVLRKFVLHRTDAGKAPCVFDDVPEMNDDSGMSLKQLADVWNTVGEVLGYTEDTTYNSGVLHHQDITNHYPGLEDADEDDRAW